MLSETAIIKHLTKESNGFVGDDAAVLPILNSEQYVITKDLLIEGIHFRSYFEPEDLAHKALHVNLSDLAAMGATPKYILCGISIPIVRGEYGQAFLDHLLHACKRTKTVLIGGDTTKSPDKFYISITAIGTSPPHLVKYRNGAQDRDVICVAGHLGWAHLGLMSLEKNTNVSVQYKNAFLRPNAKIEEGIWLGRQSYVTSMIDISDGLYIDLKHLCDISDVGGIIDLEKLEQDVEFENSCNFLTMDPLNVVLTGGEDYSLLFTVRSNYFNDLTHRFRDAFGYMPRAIGHVVSNSGVAFRKSDEFVELKLKPFTHFGESV